MRNATLSWTLPVTRESGQPLAVTDIDGTELSLAVVKADGTYGAFTFATKVPATAPQEWTFADLDFGKWVVRFVVVDTGQLRSQDVMFEFEAKDNSPPGVVTNITVVLD